MCNECDLIRITGSNWLSEYDKKKYARIEMNENSKQWKTLQQ